MTPPNFGAAADIEGEKARDLGEIEVALPADQDVFTRGAAVTARASLKHGRYLVSIPGPVLLDPRGQTERVLAKADERVVFCEAAGVFRECPGG